MSTEQEPHVESPQIRTVVRAYASALPLAFFCFGIGMLLLAATSLEWVSGRDVEMVGILLAAFVFPLEFLCCVMAFLARDAAAAATFGLFSTSWLALGLLDVVATPGSTSAAEGVYLIGFSVMILALAVVTLFGKPLLGALMVAAAARSVFDGVFQLGGATGLDRAAGVIAVVIFVAAVYIGLAMLLEDTRQREVLPTFRTGPAREAMSGDPGPDPARLRREAGVRAQL